MDTSPPAPSQCLHALLTQEGRRRVHLHVAGRVLTVWSDLGLLRVSVHQDGERVRTIQLGPAAAIRKTSTGYYTIADASYPLEFVPVDGLDTNTRFAAFKRLVAGAAPL